jgi:hypothetical protein
MSAGVICLYFGTPGECQCCGGSTHAEGGPFEPDPRFCSRECAEEIYERQSRAQDYYRNNWCPECGYDNFEHDPGCKRAKAPA